MASVAHLAPIHLGLDVHKDTIPVGILRPDQQVPTSSGSPTTSPRFAGSSAALVILACCEPATSTGPTGFELARLLASMQVSCQVVAPSLIPKAPGDKARDRPAGRPPAGPTAPRRRAGRHPHPHRRGGGRP